MPDNRSDQEKFPNSKKFSDFREEISIIELAQSIGYSMTTAWAKSKRSGNFPCLENQAGDRIYIKHPQDNQRMRFQNVDISSDEGDIVAFVKNRIDTDFKSVRNQYSNELGAINAVLYNYLNIPEQTRNEYRKVSTDGNILKTGTSDEGVFNKELFRLHKLTDTAWLNHRGIDQDTLKAEIFKDKIYNIQNPIIRDGEFKGHSSFINTGFPYQESLTGNIVGLEERNFDFKGHGVNSNKNVGVWFTNPPNKIDNVVLVESALDALSHYQLKKPENVIYFSSGGQLTTEQVQTINKVLKETKIHTETKILLGHDKDKDGAMYDLKFIADMAAYRVPMVKAVRDKDFVKLSYATENNEKMTDFANKLMAKLMDYNKPVQVELNKLESNQANDQQAKEILEKSMYRFNFEKGVFKVEIPRSYYAISDFNKSFLEVTGLEKIVSLEKGKGNDWNEDLMKNKSQEKIENNQPQHVKNEVKNKGARL
ncbi:hypothetical protein AAKU52_002616 [Pedobacter sp. CG_S7]|uniref:toprim domain-containing protein n=1 Tax=Pedobacter sp. CG_S7 TaxID=3143930 RepID=UPI0033997B39